MRERLPQVLVALVAVALAAHALGRWPLYVAEMWTWRASRAGWAELIQAVVNDRHPPLQPMMVLALRQLTDAEWLPRLPSALGALAGAWALYRAARWELGSAAFGLVAALSLVLSPSWVNYAGVMRPYGLMLGVGAGLVWAALRVREAPGRSAVALGLLGVAGLYLHYLMAAPLGTALVAGTLGALRRPQGERLRAVAGLVGAAAFVLACFGPWYLYVGRIHAAKSQFGAVSTDVYRFLLFDVGGLSSYAIPGLLLLGALGLAVSLGERRWEVLGLGLGALLLPLALSTSLEVRVRVYAFIGLLPVLVLLAVVGARRLQPRAWAWAVLALVVQGPEAWMVASLPSNPYGGHGEDFDDGVHDVVADLAIIQGALPPGTQLTVPFSLEPNIFAHYAPDALVVRTPHEGEPGAWHLLSRSIGAVPLPVNGGTGCRLEVAFALVLALPDEESCTRMLAALATGSAAPWSHERALHTEDPVEKEALLRAAMAGSSPAPHLALATLLLDQGRLDEADEVVSEGLSRAWRWSWAMDAGGLLGLRAKVLRAQGDSSQEEGLLAAMLCLRSTSHDGWMPRRCASPLTAWTVARTPPPGQGPGGAGPGGAGPGGRGKGGGGGKGGKGGKARRWSEP